jgi:uncharacterized protein (TIGR03437 family)
MHRFAALFSLPLVPALLFSSDFRSGQAASAVIGQPSFSVATGGITPTALSLAAGKLFVTDKGQRVLTFDVSRLLSSGRDRPESSRASCLVCIENPSSVVAQSVIPGVSRVSTYANSVAVADPANHRVLLWRDSTSPDAASGPDLVLGAGLQAGGPVSGSSLADPISVALDGNRLFVGDAKLHRVLIWNSLPATATQPADVVLGQPDLGSSSGVFPAAARIVRPSALLSDGTNLFVADAAAHRVLVFSPSDFPVPERSVLNSATGVHGPLAPGTLVTIEGENLAGRSETAIDDGEHSLPGTLAGIELLLNGRHLPLLSVSPHEIRCQMPYDVHGADAASLVLRDEPTPGHVLFSNAVPVEFRSASPGILAFAGAEPRAGIVVHVDGEMGATSSPVTPAEPARPGEPIVLWASGLGYVVGPDGSTQPVAGQPYGGQAANVMIPVQAELDGQPLEVVSAVLPPHAIGIYQVQVTVPGGLPHNSAAHLTISQGDSKSNTVTVPVGNPIQ